MRTIYHAYLLISFREGADGIPRFEGATVHPDPFSFETFEKDGQVEGHVTYHRPAQVPGILHCTHASASSTSQAKANKLLMDGVRRSYPWLLPYLPTNLPEEPL